MKRKPVIGETLYDLNVGNAARDREQKLTPVTVVSVGRKYFKCRPVGGDEWYDTEYHIETWSEKTEYCKNHKLYETEQEWFDERESRSIFNHICQVFNAYGKCVIPLDSLRRIKAILEESSETKI